ncbi:MAG TPA: tetratricopeptide repeat protein [Vicinamibacterales bacterium]
MIESRLLRYRPARVRAVTILALFLSIVDVSAQGSRLTGGPQLAAAYDAIVDARFDDVPALLTKACSNDSTRSSGKSAQPAPREACQLLEGVSIWWRIQLDPNNTSRDDEFRTRVDAAIAAIDAWTMREPLRAEAWFYLGGAYGARAQWRVLRGERLSAARDGKRIKDALERAVQLDPALQDAYFGIGLYHYYAAVAPAAVRFLRFLLLLPGGDREKGLEEMLRAREGGEILRSEADYQLHLIYLWYEKRTDRALELLRALHERHPRNPHFLQSIATIEDVYLHDTAASLRTWQQLLDAARAGTVTEPAMSETSARLGLARELDARGDTDDAIAHLREVIERKPAAPFGALARAQLQLGRVLDHRGQRSEAVTAYRAALDLVPPGDPDRIAPAARAGIRAPSTR